MKSLAKFLVLFVIVPLFSCEKEPTTPIDEPQIQSLDADTLFFKDEKQFHDFLFAHHLAADYSIAPPKVIHDCSILPDANTYPSQQSNDYLHEDRFTGMPFIVLFDHIATRKHINIFFPAYYDDHPGVPHDLNLCGVNEYITNPQTGQVVCFYDSFNWRDENGENIFNTNKKLWLLWGFHTGNVTFGVARIQTSTGIDFTFKDNFPEHKSLTVSFDSIAETYNHLKTQ
jgi:hypothetical protein